MKVIDTYNAVVGGSGCCPLDGFRGALDLVYGVPDA